MSPPVILAVLVAGIAAALAFPGPPPRQEVREERPAGSGAALPVVGAIGVVAIAYLMLGGTLGITVGAVGGVLGWRALGRLESRGEKQRRVALQRVAPLVADLVAAALAAGRDPGSALLLAAASVGSEAEEELAIYSASLALGAEPASVWRALGEHPQFGGVGRAFLRATETGSPVTDAMRRGAEDLRRVDRSAREAAARTVSTRAAAPLGMFLLPAFVVVGVVPLVAGAIGLLIS